MASLQYLIWPCAILIFGWSVTFAEKEIALRDEHLVPQNRYQLRSFLDVAVYVGTGYDLLRGSPDGASLTSGGMDPGLKVAKAILHQTKQPLGCIAEANCVQFDTSFTDQLYSSDIDIRSYQESLNSSWNIEGEVGFWIFKARAQASKAVNELIDEFRRYENVVLSARSLTNYGEIAYRYHEEKRLSSDFMSSVCQLPNHDRDKSQFLRFIKEWGTHVVTSARMGMRTTLRMIVKKSDFTKTAMQSSSSSYYGSLNLGVFASGNMSRSLNSRVVESIMSSSINSYTSHLVIGSEERPAPITYTLRSLDWFLGNQYLKTTAPFVKDCPLLNNNPNDTIRVGKYIKDALENYPAWENVNPNELVEVDRTIEPNWPEGQYSLLVQSSTVCPEDWANGSRRVTVNAIKPYGPDEAPSRFNEQYWPEVPVTNSLHKFDMEFCTKRLERDRTGSPAYWERGSYCIFRKGGSCLRSFPGNGTLSISYSIISGTDDYYFIHRTTGNIPDNRMYDEISTDLSYCCRDDGPVNRPLFLPTNVPFMLLPIGKGCQKVVGMSAKLKWLFTKDADIYIDPINGAGARTARTTALRFVTTTQPAPYWEYAKVQSFKLFFCEYTKTQ